jgi:hypothetical protein
MKFEFKKSTVLLKQRYGTIVKVGIGDMTATEPSKPIINIPNWVLWVGGAVAIVYLGSLFYKEFGGPETTSLWAAKSSKYM